MRKTFKLLIFVFGVFTFSSCAIHNGYMNNSVSLGQANFDYIHYNISGSAVTTHFLGLGGLGKSAIVAEAKRDMLKKNPLKSNQAIVNVTVNWKSGFYFIIMTRECTVTADVVEFYANDETRKLKTSDVNNETDEVRTSDPNKGNGETNANNIIQQKFKVGDKVQYKGSFRTIIGVISEIDGESYSIKYVNSKGVKKSLITDEVKWITKVE